MSPLAASFAWEKVSIATLFSLSKSASVVWNAYRLSPTLRMANPSEIQKNPRHGYPWALIAWLTRGEKSAPISVIPLAGLLLVKTYGLTVCSMQDGSGNNFIEWRKLSNNGLCLCCGKAWCQTVRYLNKRFAYRIICFCLCLQGRRQSALHNSVASMRRKESRCNAENLIWIRSGVSL